MSTGTGIEWTEATWARFVSQIRMGEASECWVWTAGCFASGYGQFRVGKRKVRAHRAYYERIVGPVPIGKILCHTCDNRPCCNPSHMYAGTHADNAADRGNRGRHGRGSKPRPGELNPAAKLTAEHVNGIRLAHARGDSYAVLANRLCVSKSTIAGIIKGRTWR